LRYHVVDNRRVLSNTGDILAESQTHDASRTDSVKGQPELLANDLLAANCYRVVEVISLDIAPVQVRDVKTTLGDVLERRAIIGVDCSKHRGQYNRPWGLLNVLPKRHVRTYRV
jgi:hypothetical protein